MKSIVYAVMRCTIEIPVRSSQATETMEQMLKAAKSEAEGILRSKMDDAFSIVGKVEFSHAIIKEY